MVEANFPEDVLVEILCRLPKKSLARFKCVSKQWLILISNRSRVFSRTISHAGIVCQSYLPVKFRRKASKPIIQPSRMSFLGVDNKGSASCLNPPHPTNIDEENYFLVSSCDGFLLLRKDPGKKDPVKKDCFRALVFHPPTERLWRISRSTPSHVMHVGLVSDGHHFKLALFSSFEMRGWASGPWFKLDVYSSENGIWREEKCHSPSITIPQSGNRNMDSAKSVFLSGAFHWIWGNHLVIYHLGKRDCKLLKLPPFLKNGGRRKRQHQCIWESEGYVNYCQVSAAKGNPIGIWSLHKGDQNDEQNEHSCKWKSKHWAFLARSKTEFEHPKSFSPLAFNDDFEIVYLMCERRLFSYNLATTEMKEACTSPFEGTDDRASCIALPFLYTQLDIGVTAIDDRELCKRRKKLF